jgi:hypothetical protein
MISANVESINSESETLENQEKNPQMNDTLEEFNRAYNEKENWARDMGLYGFAEKLKRERDEARKELEFRRELYKVQEEFLEAARRERDEAREQSAKLRDIAERAIRELDSLGEWRVGCHEYDENMGHLLRDFFDVKEWQLMEISAQKESAKLRSELDKIKARLSASVMRRGRLEE